METMEKKLAEAYLLGAYLGDGHCQWEVSDPRHHVYQFVQPSIDTDLLQKVRDSIHTCFPFLNERVVIEPDKDKPHRWILRCSSKDLCQFLRSRCDIKKRLPVISGSMLLKEFVAGLMDTDGWITQHYARRQKPYPWEGWVWQMGFATTSPWYQDVRELFKRSGVVLGKEGKVHKPKHKEGIWADCANVYINIASFVDAGFYFSIARKCERIQNWQQHVRGESSETRSLAPIVQSTIG